MKAAPADTGIVFIRTDIDGSPSVRANVANVVDVKRGTTIASGRAKVYTVEHVLAALHAAEIDNAYIEMDGMEPPIVDGSAEGYMRMIAEAGIQEQDSPADVFNVAAPTIIEDRETKILALPSATLRITCIIAYGATPLDAQYYSGEINAKTFGEEIAPARTFCMYHELEKLIAAGLIKGGSLDNAIVLHQGAIICREGMRFQNELVRHKILDIVGDLYLSGRRVKGHVVAIKPGHPTNIMLVQKLLASHEAVQAAV
jgi:UDP-3-O-acyl N-acetylglucosamine deacetylase